MLKRFLAGLIVAVMMASTAAAGPYEDAYAAYQRGDYTTALKLWRPLAAQGDARVQDMLGLLYAFGEGVPQDYAEAMKWYRLAAAQGNANAQNNLGVMYAHGYGVPQDFVEAAKWCRLAAEQGVSAGAIIPQ